MSLSDTLKSDLAKYADPILRALELVQSLTGIGGAGAATALQVAAAVIKTLETGVAAQLSAADILAELDKLAPGEAADDAAAAAANQAELDKYSPAGGV
jgi:hypothetical protein